MKHLLSILTVLLVLPLSSQAETVNPLDDDRSGFEIEDEVISIQVKHATHEDGVLDSSGDTSIDYINVNAENMNFGELVDICRYSLQRLGSGRARMWNAFNDGGGTDPVFTQNKSPWMNCDYGPTYFTADPGSTSINQFNEQQTYYWSQWLKTYVDEWGRSDEYPVDSGRDVNVEIAINVDASRETDICGDGVQHGCFRSGADIDWFTGIETDLEDTVPAVFLFSHPDNSGSPQYFGSEISPSYSIVAHEVGHYISWQYGSWDGPTTNLEKSLSEGFSMVIAGLIGKAHWDEELEYEEAGEITSGSKRDVTKGTTTYSTQWEYHDNSETAVRYEDLDCELNKYELAWPFTKAMWHLMNNVSETGQPLWSSEEAAVEATADMVMHSLYNYTDDSTMTFDILVDNLLTRLMLRLKAGIEPNDLGMLTYIRVREVFSEHGLLGACQ